MKWGVFSIYTRRNADGSLQEFEAAIPEWIREVEEAERLGFDTYWMAEHHFHDEGLECLPNPSILTAALASRTKHIRFGTAAYILPWHNPVRLAEDTALLDHLTGGRLDVGVARGYSPAEHAGMGAPADDEGIRQSFEEALEVLKASWSDEKLAYSADRKIHRYPPRPDVEPIQVLPKPLQKPHPPLWMALYSKKSLEFAARNGLGLIIHDQQDAVLDEFLDIYRSLASDYAGRQLRKGENVVLVKDIYLAPTNEEAKAELEDYLLYYVRYFGAHGFLFALARPGEEPPTPENVKWEFLAERQGIYGTPKLCVERMSDTLSKFPVDSLVIHLQGSDNAKRRRTLQLFAKEVRPQLEEGANTARVGGARTD